MVVDTAVVAAEDEEEGGAGEMEVSVTDRKRLVWRRKRMRRRGGVPRGLTGVSETLHRRQHEQGSSNGGHGCLHQLGERIRMERREG